LVVLCKAGELDLAGVSTWRKVSSNVAMDMGTCLVFCLSQSATSVTESFEFVILYRAETNPLRVVAVLHGKCDLKELLEERS
jgi:hypothetical protein